MNPHNNDQRFSIEAEHRVLGGLLASEAAWDACGHLVKAEDFYRYENRLIFTAIADLVAKQSPIEPLTVMDLLSQSGDLDTVGKEYLVDLYKTGTLTNIAHYAGVVRERATERRLLASAHDVMGIVADYDRPLLERANAACARIQDAVEHDTSAEVQLLYTHGREWLDDLERLSDSGAQMIGLPTGFADIDKVTLGMPDGELIVIAARPSMGKSAFALNICAHNANAGKSVFIASLEMPRAAVLNRFAASVGRVPYSKVRSAKFDEVGGQLAGFAAKLRDWKLAVDDRPRLDVNRLESCLRAHRRRHGLDLVMVDYLQLMDMGRDPNRNNAVSACTRDLKILAGTLNVPIILLSQLNRDLEKRSDKRPQMSDLRDSGSIEQDAHTLLFLYREAVYNPNTQDPWRTEVIIGKARDSERGLIIPLHTQLDKMRFGNVDWAGQRGAV